MNSVYLDHNATSPVDPRVVQVMLEAWEHPSNPSSIHKFGQKAKMMLEQAREQVLNTLDLGSDYQVIFTSSGTESNNMALRGLSHMQVVTSVIEHPSVLQVVGQGLIPVLENGVIDLIAMDEVLSTIPQPALVSVMYANNEIGVIQPIAEVIAIAKKYGALVHTDAVQMMGKMRFDWGATPPDLITISAHKFGGPQGAAALIYRKDTNLTPIMQGGGQEFRMRPGTHNLASIVGMGKACTLLPERINNYVAISKLRDYIEAKIKEISKMSVIFGAAAERLPNTSSISMPGIKAETQVIHFDLAGIALSAGSACSSGRVGIPHVQAAMGYTMDEAGSAIRVSLGPDTTLSDADKFISAWSGLYNKTNGEKR